jgi:hypothetical protein
MLKEFSQFLPDCCSELLAILMEVYTSSASAEVREKSLHALSKMVYFSSAEDLTVGFTWELVANANPC